MQPSPVKAASAQQTATDQGAGRRAVGRNPSAWTRRRKTGCPDSTPAACRVGACATSSPSPEGVSIQ
ncbi:hypothetical protein J4732_15305, partial [Serratia marcescens]|nr:hypothetical protein [Serratia marcescens]